MLIILLIEFGFPTIIGTMSILLRKTWPFIYIFRFSSIPVLSFSFKTTLLTSVRGYNSFSRSPSLFLTQKQALPPFLSKQRIFLSSSDDFSTSSKNNDNDGTTTSVDFAMDPYTDEARSITSALGITSEQHEKLTQLSDLVVQWNERLNLISRKDCTIEVVFGRHVLPSIALAALPQFQSIRENSSDPRIVDVGTGGGFPGLPLSIIFPEADFLLVDSVGKKLKAIAEMATELRLENISTHHGRAEQIADDPLIGRKHRRKYDICVGRSVTAMPRFCFWIQDLLKSDGKLVYIIGGEIESSVQSRVEDDVLIDKLLQCEGASDKRTLVLTSKDVIAVARESGEKKVGNSRGKSRNSMKKKTRQNDDGKWNKSKGGWSDRNNVEKKDRGYSNFKRYEIE